MDEEDLYGDDIYHGVAVDVKQPSLAAAPLQQDTIKAETAFFDSDNKVTRPEQNGMVAVFDQAGHSTAAATAAASELQDWQSAFQHIAEEAQLPLRPSALAAELQSLRQQSHSQTATPTQAADLSSQSKEQLQGQVDRLLQKEQTMHMQLAEKTLENLELRRHLHSARQAADPSIVQVRQLQLDPAVAREFQRMTQQLQDKSAEVRRLDQELQATHFTQESKTGRLLMAKCRTLQEENEEMGRELGEGRVHALERQLALARGFAEDMRRVYQELEDHCSALDEEAEKLQDEAFLLRRKVQEAETHAKRAVHVHRGGLPDRDRRPGFGNFNGVRPYGSPPGHMPRGRMDAAGMKRGPPSDRRDDGDRFGARTRMR